MSIIWSVFFGIAIFQVYRDKRTSGILGLVVFSYWILDLIVHLPDLPLFLEGSPNLGFGLWGSGLGLIASIILELTLFAGGIVIYTTWQKRYKQFISQEQIGEKSNDDL